MKITSAVAFLSLLSQALGQLLQGSSLLPANTLFSETMATMRFVLCMQPRSFPATSSFLLPFFLAHPFLCMAVNPLPVCTHQPTINNNRWTGVVRTCQSSSPTSDAARSAPVTSLHPQSSSGAWCAGSASSAPGVTPWMSLMAPRGESVCSNMQCQERCKERSQHYC